MAALQSYFEPILSPLTLALTEGGGGIGALLAMLLTEEGERITTEESQSIEKEAASA